MLGLNQDSGDGFLKLCVIEIVPYFNPIRVTPSLSGDSDPSRCVFGFQESVKILSSQKEEPLSLHRSHTEGQEVYFCTITCYKWLPLFEETQSYASVYRWFHHLKNDGCLVLGFVIMPNHIHVLLFQTHTGTSLSKLVGEGKRFMAYDIVHSLKNSGKDSILKTLQQGVEAKEKLKGKKHQVFRLSFDARKCFSERMIEQKLDYIHHNPVSGKWDLIDDFARYPHSSAQFYELGLFGGVEITHYKDLC